MLDEMDKYCIYSSKAKSNDEDNALDGDMKRLIELPPSVIQNAEKIWSSRDFYQTVYPRF